MSILNCIVMALTDIACPEGSARVAHTCVISPSNGAFVVGMDTTAAENNPKVMNECDIIVN